MSSHEEWEIALTAQHDRDKPFAPENGQELRFKVGDLVFVTNSEGCELERPFRIKGFYERPEGPSGLYASGARYYLDWDCHWFPVSESQLRPANIGANGSIC